MAIVGAVLPWIEARFLLPNTLEPNAGGKVEFFITGTSTPKDTFADAGLTIANANPVILDAEGRAVIFLSTGGYDVKVYDVDNLLLYTWTGVEDYGLTFLSNLGLQLTTGSLSVTSGYTVLVTDTFVTVNSTGATNPCVINLPLAAAHPLPVAIKNMGTNPLAITPNGAQKVESGSVGVPYSVPAAASPAFPTVWLTNDGVSSWWIQASHKL